MGNVQVLGEGNQTSCNITRRHASVCYDTEARDCAETILRCRGAIKQCLRPKQLDIDFFQSRERNDLGRGRAGSIV